MPKTTKTKRIEIRNDDDGTLDEVIVHKPDLIHFERMSDQSIWCGITVGKKELRVWISAKNGRSHVNYTVESDE